MSKELHPLVALAKEAVETYVRDREIARPAVLTPEMKEKSGVFVSIHKHGQLRGCIGTFEPARPNVAQELVFNAISSATRDYRFSPVTANELPELSYKVDILTRPELVLEKSELDPRRYGVLAVYGNKRGILLPDLPGVTGIDQQIEIACSKGGIEVDEPAKLYKFEVRRFE